MERDADEVALLNVTYQNAKMEKTALSGLKKTAMETSDRKDDVVEAGAKTVADDVTALQVRVTEAMDEQAYAQDLL